MSGGDIAGLIAAGVFLVLVLLLAVPLLALLVVLALVSRRCIREIRSGGSLALVAVAVLLALPAMLVELYLFRGFPTAMLWWATAMAVGRHNPNALDGLNRR